MKRTRHVLVMTLVATALCADRVATAAPELRQLQPTADPIARLATKLSDTFRRVVPAVRLHQARQENFATSLRPAPIVPVIVGVHPTEGSLFQFRLPPPSL